MTQLMQCVANQVIERRLRDVSALVNTREDNLSIDARQIVTVAIEDDASSRARPQDIKLTELVTTVIEDTLKGSSDTTFYI